MTHARRGRCATDRWVRVTGRPSPRLHAFCRDHLAAYKTPVTSIFVDAFLPIASGKVCKNVLHERCPAECLHRPSGDLVGLAAVSCVGLHSATPPLRRTGVPVVSDVLEPRRQGRGRRAYTDSISRAASCPASTACALLVDHHTAPSRAVGTHAVRAQPFGDHTQPRPGRTLVHDATHHLPAAAPRADPPSTPCGSAPPCRGSTGVVRGQPVPVEHIPARPPA